MEYLVALLTLSIIGLFYFKNKFDRARIDLLLGKTKEKDKQLKKDLKDVNKSIREMDENIEKIKAERKKRREDMTREERAKEWKDQ